MVRSAITLHPMPMRTSLFAGLAAVTLTCAGLIGAEPPGEAAADPPRITVPAQAQPILPLRDVRIGQRGYGLTVFAGTRIEPFPVEVVSVMTDFEPQRGVVWIMCDDPRLNLSGPVQGMSGSPIYLWDEGEAQELGQGGRLIGAFAFGFGLSKVCLAGVQPIEQMRETAGRAEADNAKAALGPTAAESLSRLAVAAEQRGSTSLDAVRLRAMWQLAQRLPGAETQTRTTTLPNGPAGQTGQVQPLSLPLTVGDAQVVEMLRPMLDPMGVSLLAAPAGAAVAGRPPLSIDAEAVRIEPGSVLSVPLGWGDMDLSASGTVTDVLPDGRVLGFGHAMFGQGDLGVPMATGYVHTVVPLLTTSFKLSGSLRMAGALIRDEGSGVVGIAEPAYHAAPVTVNVQWGDAPARTYRYHAAHHRMFTPMIAAIVTVQSVVARQSLPMEHTLRATSRLSFSDGRQLDLDTVGAGNGQEALIYAMLPPLTAMMQNPFTPLQLEGVEVAVRIDPTLDAVTLVDGRMDRVEAAPGQTVGISLRLQPYGKPMTTQRIELTIPQDLPDGDYELVVCDAQSYLGRMMSTKPHRMTVRSLDDLEQALRELLTVDSTAVYALLQLPQQGLAYGRTEMPRLPSSRRAIVQAPTTTAVIPFTQWHERKIPIGSVTSGEVSFTVSVRRPYQAR